ncbi:MAG: hypothetical protein WCE63_23865, partial [Acidobacteriaceae bacterium]
FLRPLDHPHAVFDGAAWDRLKYQLDCPFHPQRLTQPTTLHTLLFEKTDKLRGTCLHIGCIPTRALLLNAEI